MRRGTFTITVVLDEDGARPSANFDFHDIAPAEVGQVCGVAVNAALDYARRQRRSLASVGGIADFDEGFKFATKDGMQLESEKITIVEKPKD